jgi:hypothetical protein
MNTNLLFIEMVTLLNPVIIDHQKKYEWFGWLIYDNLPVSQLTGYEKFTSRKESNIQIIENEPFFTAEGARYFCEVTRKAAKSKTGGEWVAASSNSVKLYSLHCCMKGKCDNIHEDNPERLQSEKPKLIAKKFRLIEDIGNQKYYQSGKGAEVRKNRNLPPLNYLNDDPTMEIDDIVEALAEVYSDKYNEFRHKYFPLEKVDPDAAREQREIKDDAADIKAQLKSRLV